MTIDTSRVGESFYLLSNATCSLLRLVALDDTLLKYSCNKWLGHFFD